MTWALRCASRSTASETTTVAAKTTQSQKGTSNMGASQ